MGDIRHHCKWLGEYIDTLWNAHTQADSAILALPNILINKLDALTRTPWRASVRRNCLDLVLKWPGEIHHQTSYAAKKVFGRADELLEHAKDHSPYAAWSDFQTLLAGYRHDLVAIRDAVSQAEPDAPRDRKSAPSMSRTQAAELLGVSPKTLANRAAKLPQPTGRTGRGVPLYDYGTLRVALIKLYPDKAFLFPEDNPLPGN